MGWSEVQILLSLPGNDRYYKRLSEVRLSVFLFLRGKFTSGEGIQQVYQIEVSCIPVASIALHARNDIIV